MKVALGSDHAGYGFKNLIKTHLEKKAIDVIDFGTDSARPCDYPDFVRPAAEAVAKGEAEFGIVLGGSGNGEAIVANKVPGVRCALCFSSDTARWARGHNNANVLAIGERTVSESLALEIVDLFLETGFEGGRHQKRVDKIESG